jgi:hypothetical protein
MPSKLEASSPPDKGRRITQVAGPTQVAVCEGVVISRIQPTPKSFRVNTGDGGALRAGSNPWRTAQLKITVRVHQHVRRRDAYIRRACVREKMECEAAHFGATVVRALVFARGASEVLSEICRPVRRQGVARYQHGGLQIPPQTRFGLIDTVVNVDRLRPYKQRPPDLGPSEEDAQPEALIVDPRGGTWWEVEDVVAHRWRKGQRKFPKVQGFRAVVR